MATLSVFAPSPENQALLAEIPGVRQTPVPVIGFDGPEGHLGPEAAGAVLVLHMTMSEDDARAQAFWRQVALTCKAASTTPGFIRMVGFFDGAANWALGFWRRVEDAQAFARSRPHLDAVADMHAKSFEYTHFAGLFSPVQPRTRQAYCDACAAEVFMPAASCPSCGNALVDVFVVQARDGQG